MCKLPNKANLHIFYALLYVVKIAQNLSKKTSSFVYGGEIRFLYSPRSKMNGEFSRNRTYETVPALWGISQVVKTPPFHGGIVGSNPAYLTSLYYSILCIS